MTTKEHRSPAGTRPRSLRKSGGADEQDVNSPTSPASSLQGTPLRAKSSGSTALGHAQSPQRHARSSNGSTGSPGNTRRMITPSSSSSSLASASASPMARHANRAASVASSTGTSDSAQRLAKIRRRPEMASSPDNARHPSNGKKHSYRLGKVGEAFQIGKVGVLPLKDEALMCGDDGRAVVWLDIDNTLYRKSTRIAELMTERIRAYFLSLGLSSEEAERLHSRYYKEYGLAIRGLVMHHKIDALDYDAKCDAALPLERILRPSKSTRALLRDLDRTKCRIWALTNAYKTHAVRVLDLLGLKDQIEGVIFCDYAMDRFACKPEPDFYNCAMEAIGLQDPARCYFVDDSALNIIAARGLAWKSCVLFKEQDQYKEEDEDSVGRDDRTKSPLLAYDFDETKGRLAFRHEDDIAAQLKALPSPLRQRLLQIALTTCNTADVDAVRTFLLSLQISTKDVFRDLPGRLLPKIFAHLPIRDLLRCRRVSRQWHHWSYTSALWKAQALELSNDDTYSIKSPASDEGWEEISKRLYFRERNWATGRCASITHMQGHTGFVTAMKLKGQSTLVTGSYDETIRVWNLMSGNCTKVLKAKAIACLDFSAKDGILAAGLYDTGRVMVWDMRTWTLLQTLNGHNKGIRHVSMSSDYLVSVGQDKAIVIWDWKTGLKLVRFGQQSNVSLGVSFVGKDKLVAVTVDGVIRTFDLAGTSKDMIGQFDVRNLSAELKSRLAGLKDGSNMLQWFAADGDTMTLGSSTTIIHLKWKSRAGRDTDSTDLTAPPIVVSIVDTLDSAIGCVDAAKQRIVCASRFSPRAGAERRLYTATFRNHRLRETTKPECASTNGNADDHTRGVVAIGGAWQTHAEQLSMPAHNPMSLVLNQDYCVVGTSSGLVYSLDFNGEQEWIKQEESRHGGEEQSALATPRPVSSALPQVDTGALNVEIAHLSELRRVWSHLFVQ